MRSAVVIFRKPRSVIALRHSVGEERLLRPPSRSVDSRVVRRIVAPKIAEPAVNPR